MSVSCDEKLNASQENKAEIESLIPKGMFEVDDEHLVTRFAFPGKNKKIHKHAVFSYGSDNADISVYLITDAKGCKEKEIWDIGSQVGSRNTIYNKYKSLARLELIVKDIKEIYNEEDQYRLNVLQKISAKDVPHPVHVVISDKPYKRRSIGLDVQNKLYNCIKEIIYQPQNEQLQK